ncbi:glycoside hydrolase family 88 protein [Gilvimarinus sp. SDUM040013]|uniref:Glycoside hydrolase family 88 protein n=1 Tax=Gilvimarinus gilvus TaxID=3058038 RepID=A0ABU4S463_9GAMM|nr:glycoside hydrolase family 88 protein [Gilvimarinus sp. SDUM040013]MDO3384560.1 glycoside hydrolase family 88 protein [Gilvimarinus sp. SDUM040013]MDX6850104.1 glycoside hydrolase family 88 protein [Gilvimarinus sp. SDUM040013]
MQALRSTLLALTLLFAECAVAGTSHDNTDAIAQAAIEDLLSRPDYMMYISDHFTGFHYAEAAAAYGALKYARLSDNQVLTERLLARYETVPGTADLLQDEHVDANVYGILPIERYFTNGDQQALATGLELADDQWAAPLENGLTRQTRYWIDDVWMIGALQIQAYRATEKPIYLHRAALQINAYLHKLQQPNGLFYHGPDAPFFWGRGNGWVAAGLAELISELPEDHLLYGQISESYQRMMAALLQYQATDGMWRQLLDYPDAWKESSGTAMFAYAIAVGVERGLLPKESYQHAVDKAWQALSKRVTDNGQLTDVCVGTGQSQDAAYYLERPRITGDLHGQAPLLWLATARLLPE